jgi:carbonic anhydrase/acetyltransferase-like protein (isoleucine patch superfamily)
VLRGDKNSIEIGQFSNVQDRVVIDTVTELESGWFHCVKMVKDAVTLLEMFPVLCLSTLICLTHRAV